MLAGRSIRARIYPLSVLLFWDRKCIPQAPMVGSPSTRAGWKSERKKKVRTSSTVKLYATTR